MITGSWVGYRYRNGERTDEITQVVAVDKKIPLEDLKPEEVLPDTVDVVEAVFEALSLKTFAMSLTDFKRPCPPGYSIGHVDVTAGTLGAWVKVGDTRVALSNNHVLANSNDAQVGDRIVQPGMHDDPSGQPFGVLDSFVPIDFGDGLNKKKSKGLAKLWWATWRGIANLGARVVNCPFRLQLTDTTPKAENLVDAALCLPDSPDYADLTVPVVGVEVKGMMSLWLGDEVVKVGRTTGFTRGVVEGVSASVTVGFGFGKSATFVDQVIIRGESGEFSAGGDSGSAILIGDRAGGLLFAGGGGLTIANRIENVIDALGISF